MVGRVTQAERRERERERERRERKGRTKKERKGEDMHNNNWLVRDERKALERRKEGRKEGRIEDGRMEECAKKK